MKAATKFRPQVKALLTIAIFAACAALIAQSAGVWGISVSDPRYVHLALTAFALIVTRLLITFGWPFFANKKGYANTALWLLICPALMAPIILVIGNIYVLKQFFSSEAASVYWLSLVIVPSILCLSAFFFVPNQVERPQSRPEPGTPESREAVKEAAAASNLIPAKRLLGSLAVPSFYLSFIFFILCVNIIFSYFDLISAASLQSEFKGWAVLLSPLRGVKNFVFNEWPFALLLFGWLAGVNILFAFLDYRRAATYLKRRPEYNRDLSKAELELIEKETARLSQILEENLLKGSRTVSTVFAYAAYIAFIAALLLGVEWELPIGYEHFKADRIPTDQWFMYIDKPNVLVGLALCHAAASWAFFAWSWLRPDWAGFDFPESWALQRGPSRREVDLKALRRTVAGDVRSGWITDEGEIDPLEYFAWSRGRGFRRVFFFASIASVVTAFFWFAERMEYKLITNEGIEYRKYLSLGTQRATFAEIDQINVECRTSSAKQNLQLGYEFQTSSGGRLVLIEMFIKDEMRKRLPKLIDDWERADALARQAGATVHNDQEEQPDGSIQTSYDRQACIAGLDELVGFELREKIIPLLEN